MIDTVRQYLCLALAVIDGPPAAPSHARVLVFWAVQEAIDTLEQVPDEPLAPGGAAKPLAETLEGYGFIQWHLRGASALADSDHFHGNETLVKRSVRLALERLPSALEVEEVQPVQLSKLN